MNCNNIKIKHTVNKSPCSGMGYHINFDIYIDGVYKEPIGDFIYADKVYNDMTYKYDYYFRDEEFKGVRSIKKYIKTCVEEGDVIFK